MPPFQFEMYLKDGWKRCDKNGGIVDDKEEITDFERRAKINADRKAAKVKRLAAAAKARKDKIVADLEKLAKKKDKAAKARAAEALRIANVNLDKAKKAVK